MRRTKTFFSLRPAAATWVARAAGAVAPQIFLRIKFSILLKKYFRLSPAQGSVIREGMPTLPGAHAVATVACVLLFLLGGFQMGTAFAGNGPDESPVSLGRHHFWPQCRGLLC